MSLILNALAFLPQASLAKFTGSTKICTKCDRPYGVRGLDSVVFPCGHIFGDCQCIVKKAESEAAKGQKLREYVSVGNPSSQLECPYCGTLAVAPVDQSKGEKQDNTTVVALHSAEGLLSREKKAVLLRELESMKSGEGCTWEQGAGGGDGVGGAQLGPEMDFNDILEYGN